MKLCPGDRVRSFTRALDFSRLTLLLVVLSFAVLAVLDEYLDVLNRVEIWGVTDCYHFPHVHVRGVDLAIWETALQARALQLRAKIRTA